MSWRSLRRVGIVYDKVLEIVNTDLVYDEVHGIVDGVPSLLSRKLCRELLRNFSHRLIRLGGNYILNFVVNYFGTARSP